MRKLSFLLFTVIALSFASCGGDNTATLNGVQCTATETLLTSTRWDNPVSGIANIGFSKQGIYSENDTQAGTWELIENCTILRIAEQINTWEAEIISISETELIIKNPTFGELKYYAN